MRLPVSRIILLVCALLAVIPATAGAATPPKVTSVAPLKLKIGERLTIRGKGFLPGKNRNTVVFKATGTRAVFAKAASATKTRLAVKVPVKLSSFLKVKAGQPTATRFQLRVLARKLSPAYTPAKRSPVIAPAAAAAATKGPDAKAPVTAATPAAGAAAAAPAAAAPAAATPTPTPAPSVDVADCDSDGTPDATDDDDDNDLLPDTDEAAVGSERCNADSDGDTVTDGFEYESAYDLNGRVNWFPGKRPYQNGKDASDAAFDFDGDGLTLLDEYHLWNATSGKLPLNYSDGDQDSTGTGNVAAQSPALASALDRNGDGFLTDDEKDADADALTNWEELHGPMQISWWESMYSGETQFAGRPGAAPLYETDVLLADTDGDGIRDGADDQDHDGRSNVRELYRDDEAAWVHVYNPCLPNPESSYCTLHPPFADPWAPFGRVDSAGDTATNLVWPRG